jgi:hypothetical protein
MRTLLALLLPVALFGASDVVLTDVTASTQTNRPTTIHRMFAQGEIQNFPRPSVGGTPVTQWQSNVLNRWPDNSVKFVLITFFQSFTANQAVTVAFVNDTNPCHLGNQTTCDAAGPSQSQILSFNTSGWGAGIITTTAASGDHITSARTMVGAGAWRFRVTGPLMSQIIVEDRTSSLAYDYGYKDKRYTRAADGNSILDTVTSFPVLDAGDYTAGGSVILWDSEQMLVTGISTNTITVTRGYNSTTPAIHVWYGDAGSSKISLTGQSEVWVAARNTRYKSLHPIFVVTQYKTAGGGDWAGAKIEYILENTWLNKQQDQKYDVTLKSGSALATTKYTKTSFLHNYGSRWRKTYWDGTQPGDIKIDLGRDYLIDSKAVFSYDKTITLNGSSVSNEITLWNSTDKCDLGGFGAMTTGFESTGGRPELGPVFTAWAVKWLYSQDPTMLTAFLDLQSCAAYPPVHFREDKVGDTGSRYYDIAGTIDPFGREVQWADRPHHSFKTLQLADGDPIGNNPVAISAISGGTAQSTHPPAEFLTSTPGWGPDVAHQGDMAYMPYLATGDWYWDEELRFWAGWDSVYGGPAGHNGIGGYLDKASLEVRGQARALILLAHAAFIAPTGDPAGPLYTTLVNNNIAVREGQFSVTDGSFYSTTPGSAWYVGRNTIANGLSNPLYIFAPAGSIGDIFTADPGSFDSSKSCGGWGPWMTSLNVITFGRLAELGFSASAVLRAHSKWLIHGLTDPAYSPYLMAVYQYPEFTKTSPCNTSTPYLQTWTDMASVWTTGSIASKQAYYWTNGGGGYGLARIDGYPYLTRAAASFTRGTTDGSLSGTNAWNWIYAQPGATVNTDADPKWALVPRTGQGGTKRYTGKVSVSGKAAVQ